MSFVHLHVHTEFSLLDGLSKIDKLVSRVKALKMPAMAITDHGSMYGTVKFYLAAKEAGIKPIIGVELYQASRTRFDKEGSIDKEPFHILLLAKDIGGYKNLMKLVTLAHLEGFYYKPRLDRELLEKYHQGLIATSGCLQGMIPQLVLRHNLDAAKREINWFTNLFKDDFYLEIQSHPRIPEQADVNQELIKLSRQLGVPLVATNDVHYAGAGDAEAQDALLAVQTKKLLTDKNRLTMLDSPDFYLKSGREMREAFPDLPEAIENTVKIANQCQLEIPIGKWILPNYPIEPGETPESMIKKLTEEGLKLRFKNINQEMKARANYELGVICKKGFATYFLIVQDFVNWAKREGVRVGPGRGSVAGSLVAYALRITSINPLEHNIPFERFLNPDRPTPPDIDLDFADDRRDEVIEYVTQKYGRDRVAQIITFGTMEARQAIRDIGRVMDLPYSLADKLAKMIPVGSNIEEALNSSFELQEEAKDPNVARLLSLVKKVEGVVRHASTHAAGVVIADRDLTEYSPLQKESKENRIITQYDMYSLDLNVSEKAIGLLKMDFLGLRNLTILGRAVEMVEKNRGIKVDLSEIPLDERPVFKMISAGETTGVFQLESRGMRRLARNLKPNKFSDITAMVALFRPGPMELINDFVEGKKNPRRVKYLHPDLEPVLKPTYGVAVYQEQCMQIANIVAGYSMAEADNLRRAIGKKKKSIMAREKKKFVEGAANNRYDRTMAEKIWGFIEKFVGYGFNIPHSVSYAMIAYQTAYMKVKYPVEYMAALLSVESRGASGPARDAKVSRGIEECRRLKINVLAPDINRSGEDFILEKDLSSRDGTAIRFGLSAVKNVGAAAIQSILKGREGPQFASLDDFVRRVDTQKVNKKVLESLIKVGALDSFPGTRAGKLSIIDAIRSRALAEQKIISSGQTSLFGESEKSVSDNLPAVGEFSSDELLKIEKELLGIYLTEHPLHKYLSAVSDKITDKIGDITVEEYEGREIVVAGMCVQCRPVQTRRSNQTMCFATLEDDTASVDLVIFPELYKKHQPDITANQPLLVLGRIDYREEKLSLVASRIVNLRAGINQAEIAVMSLPNNGSTRIIEVPRNTKRAVLEQLAAILKSNRGRERVRILLPMTNGESNSASVKAMDLPYRVNWKSVEQKISNLLKSAHGRN